MPRFGFRLLFLIVGVQACLLLTDYYERINQGLSAEDFLCLSQALGFAGILLGTTYLVFPFLLAGRGVTFIAIALISVMSVVSRAALLRTPLFARRQNILVLGTGHLARLLAGAVEGRRDLSINVVGFVAENGGSTGSGPSLSQPVLGVMADVAEIVDRYPIRKIVVAIEERRGSFPILTLVRLRVKGIVIEDVHTTLAALSGHVWLRALRPSTFVFSEGFHRSRITMATKRTVDLFIACTGFLISLPLQVAVAIAVALESPGGALYRQTRVGRRGQEFQLLKFRSMRSDAEATGALWATADDPRITRIGRFIRKYRLDELPQFLNIIRGDMSFVGPRPERPEFVGRLREAIPYYDERHSIRPGLTGWAQICFGYGSTIEDAARKLEYDLFYLQNMSLLFDLTIVTGTVRTVLSGFERRLTPAGGQPELLHGASSERV